VFATAVLTMIGLCAFSRSPQSSPIPGSESDAKPLLLEKNEGELRTRRIHTDNSAMPAHEFMLKVSPKNNGSQHLVLGTEELAPGAAI
jgi:quercetin dioxygenase-like cupin family protein